MPINWKVYTLLHLKVCISLVAFFSQSIQKNLFIFCKIPLLYTCLFHIRISQSDQWALWQMLQLPVKHRVMCSLLMCWRKRTLIGKHLCVGCWCIHWTVLMCTKHYYNDILSLCARRPTQNTNVVTWRNACFRGTVVSHCADGSTPAPTACRCMQVYRVYI